MSFPVYPAMEVDLPRSPRKRNRVQEDALEEAERLLEDHERLYLVDRQGLQRNRSDVGFVQEMGALGEVWLDAGPRHEEDIMDLLVAGAHHVVARWNTLETREELAAAAAFSGNLSLGLEFTGRDLVTNPREPDATAKELTRWAQDQDVGIVTVGHPDDEGRLRSETHASRVHGFRGPLHYMGPLRKPMQREKLERLGYDGLFTSTWLGGE